MSSEINHDVKPARATHPATKAKGEESIVVITDKLLKVKTCNYSFPIKILLLLNLNLQKKFNLGTDAQNIYKRSLLYFFVSKKYVSMPQL